MREQIIELLESTERKGIDKLIEYLEVEGFFDAPASTKFHGCYKGGLAAHSLRVYELVLFYSGMKLDAISSPGQKPLEIKLENLIIAALLHDVCKIGAYIGTEKPYKYNRKQPKGHALLSIDRIKKFIELDPLEEMMIKFHMGLYSLYEMYEKDSWEYGRFAEYHLRSGLSKNEELPPPSMTKEESQKARYGKSLRNAYFHNPVSKLIYFCDEIAVMEEKAKISQ